MFRLNGSSGSACGKVPRAVLAFALSGALVFAPALAGCSSSGGGSSDGQQQSQAQSAASRSASQSSTASALSERKESLVSAYADKFEQVEYADEKSGLSVTYNLFLPADYDESKSYPLVVFIADSSCTGTDATRSLSQGLGALVWASDEWQAEHECIVCVPSYPETILDDHDGYTTTDYVELTKRLIDNVADSYAVDAKHIYGTGQSMGCMTTLILASEYPDLYAGCLFVDGQWDTSKLAGLEGQSFVYFAAEDDTSAYEGLTAVKDMFDKDGEKYSYAQWDGTWGSDEISSAASELFSSKTAANFVSWKTGTIEASGGGGGMRGDGGPQGSRDGGPQGSRDGNAPDGKPADGSQQGSQGGPQGQPPQGEPPQGERPSDAGGSQDGGPQGDGGQRGGGNGGMGGGGSVHMASFDYAYNCTPVMEWLFQQ